MKSLFLFKDGLMIPMGDHSDMRQINSIINSFCESHDFQSHYKRYFNEEKQGKMMTCIDFGSWSDFFYVYPAMNIAEEFHK